MKKPHPVTGHLQPDNIRLFNQTKTKKSKDFDIETKFMGFGYVKNPPNPWCVITEVKVRKEETYGNDPILPEEAKDQVFAKILEEAGVVYLGF